MTYTKYLWLDIDKYMEIHITQKTFIYSVANENYTEVLKKHKIWTKNTYTYMYNFYFSQDSHKTLQSDNRSLQIQSMSISLLIFILKYS